MRLICSILLSCLCGLSEVPQARALLMRAHEQTEQEKPLRSRYTYFEDQESSQPAGNGKPSQTTRRTYECLFLEGEIYRKLVAENGMPLSAKKQKAVEEDLAKEKSKRIENRRRFNQIRKNIVLGTIPRLLELHTLSEPQAETLVGRKVWRVETQPRTDVVLQEKDREVMAKRTVFWLDEETGAVVQREDRIQLAVNGFEPGSVFRFQFERVNGECWMMRQVEMEGGMRLMKVKTVPFRSVQRYRDFRKFDVESTLTPIAF